MKNIIFVVVAIAFSVVFSGCVSSGPAPQDVALKNPDGRAVIIKDIYSLPLIENTKLKETEIIKVFFPKADNVNMKCSMTLLKIPSGISPPKYKQTSSQIIYAISGGGKLLINNNMVILKKGIMVYVPPNTTMSITNNVNQILELIIVTSPPFETSQMTLLEDSHKKVKVSKDLEDSMNNDKDESQALSEKYKDKKRRKGRKLSVEEYRNTMSKDLFSVPEDKDTISDLLKDDVKDKSKAKKDTWSLKLPDSSKVPLKNLERAQREKLIPKTPQKIENVTLKHIQDLTPQEQQVPVRKENTKSIKVMNKSPKNDQDSLEKLLNEQEKLKVKITPKKNISKEKNRVKISKIKKVGLENVQELSPAEKAVPTKSDTNPNL